MYFILLMVNLMLIRFKIPYFFYNINNLKNFAN
jgi:hypothetical protein